MTRILEEVLKKARCFSILKFFSLLKIGFKNYFWRKECKMRRLKPGQTHLRILSKLMRLTLYCIMLENGQTYFKNLAVFTPQDF